MKVRMKDEKIEAREKTRSIEGRKKDFQRLKGMRFERLSGIRKTKTDGPKEEIYREQKEREKERKRRPKNSKKLKGLTYNDRKEGGLSVCREYGSQHARAMEEKHEQFLVHRACYPFTGGARSVSSG